MFKLTKSFRSWLTALVLVLGVQFNLLPFYHYHPDQTHGHGDQLSPHKHEGHFHSLELENIARRSHSHHHNSHHPVGQDEDYLRLEFNKETLKPQKVLEFLKIFETHSFTATHYQPQTAFVFVPRSFFKEAELKYKLRERSPPPFSI